MSTLKSMNKAQINKFRGTLAYKFEGHSLSIGYTPRARLLNHWATSPLVCRRHEVAKSLGNQSRGVQPACTMTSYTKLG